MKPKPPDSIPAPDSTTIRFLSIILVAFLTIISASAAPDAETVARQLSAAEKWVVTQVTAGEIADLDWHFPDVKDRKLSAHFLKELLTGTMPGVEPRRNGVRIIGATVAEPIALRNELIPFEVWLNHCQFTSRANFLRASFAATISFEDSTFAAGASFYGIKVGNSAIFQNAVFEGSVDFGSADFATDFVADKAQFKNKVESTSFNGMKVRGSAFFHKAVFEGTVDFILADIAGNFEANEAQFTNKEQSVDFHSMKVGKIAFFKKAVFEGPVEFVSADIAANFQAEEAQFRSKTYTVWLAMKCGGQGNFTGASFAGPASFADSTFLDLMIGGMKSGAASVPELDLSRSSIKRQLRIRQISIHDLLAPSLHVEGPAELTDITVKHSADLRYGNFATLDLSRSIWPKDTNREAFHMQGMSYKYVRAAPNEPESHEALLKLASEASYTADVYRNLEEFFSRQGYREDADRAFIAGKCRERKEYLHGRNWLGSWLLDKLVGYGRHPSQAGYLCVFFVGLGCFLFSSQKMELQEPANAPRIYNSFWYSLGLFLPFVDLQVAKVWKPKRDQTFLRNYMGVHILLGWILIPIVLAALTGFIK